MPSVATTRMWMTFTLVGVGLICLGIGAFGFREIFSDTFGDYNYYFAIIGLGLLALLVGIVGLTMRMDQRKRRRVSGFLLLGPFVVCVLAFLCDPNFHGVAPLFFLGSIPIWLLGVGVFLASLRG